MPQVAPSGASGSDSTNISEGDLDRRGASSFAGWVDEARGLEEVCCMRD